MISIFTRIVLKKMKKDNTITEVGMTLIIILKYILLIICRKPSLNSQIFLTFFQEPMAYKLVLKLPYPVCEDQGSAKFDKSQHNLVVTLPVKAKEPVSRLISTDSGINMEFDDDFVDDYQSLVS